MQKSNKKSVTILVPTMNKATKNEIISLCEQMNISSDAVIANQCGKNSEYDMYLKGRRIKVICTNSIGVSKNRNLLLQNAFGTYAFFMDDDGIMENDYENTIISEFNKTENEWIKFNVEIIENAKREKNTLCLKNGDASYRMVSQYGMPGFAFVVNSGNQKFHFDENVGAPNYIYHGEDSLFINTLYKKKKIYCSTSIVASIIQQDSTWFTKYDDQYYITQGYLYKRMHPRLASLFIIRMFLKKRKLFNQSFNFIFKRAKIGFKMVKLDSSQHKSFAAQELMKL